MRHSRPGAFRDQATFLRRQFLQDGDFPFADVLTEDTLAQALATVGGSRRACPVPCRLTFAPPVTSAAELVFSLMGAAR